MAGGNEKWYFTKEQLQNSPSRRCGLDADKELAYRQQAATLIQDMGQRLQVSQLCINTAIVYMHRFYAFHSFTHFHRNAIAAAALFLAAKVEEQPRKLEYVIKVAHVCIHRGEAGSLSPEQYSEQAQDLVFNENVLLQTLGFDVAIDHPHTHVVRACHLVKAPKDLAQTSYFMASNGLHLTTMCLQYRPTVVACFCIHLASKWSSWSIPQSNEGRHWFSYVDQSVTCELLERLTAEFLMIIDKCPSRLRRKITSMNNGSSPHGSHASTSTSSPFDKKHGSVTDEAFDKEYERERRRATAPSGYVPAATPQASATATAQSQPPPPAQPQPANKIDYTLYREKREREERERRQQALQQRVADPTRNPESARTHNAHTKPPTWPQRPAPPRQHHRPHTQTHPDNPTQPHRTRIGIFSPENATTPIAAATATATATATAPRRAHHPQPVPKVKLEPKQEKAAQVVREMQQPTLLSPFSSPPAKDIKPRQRVQSNSEPELVPVVKKIEETPGYENVIKDSQRGTSIKARPMEIKREMKQEPREIKQEPREMPVRSLNGIETDPTLVSNLLKESLAKPAPITVATERKSPLVEVKREPVPEVVPKKEPIQDIAPPAPTEMMDHKHKKEKKKKEKHKHKDRDKSKEERKKHKKDKEKKKESSPTPTDTNDGALRITIPRDKLSTSPGLKIKIPKERLAAPPPPPSSLKIKIPKDVLETRKRPGPQHPEPPQPKMPRHNGNKVSESTENGYDK